MRVVLWLHFIGGDGWHLKFATYVVSILFHPNSVGSRFAYDGNSSSDSEEEILRRLKLQQSCSLHSSGQLSRYGAGALSPLDPDLASSLGGLQHITIGSPLEEGQLSRKESRKHHHHNSSSHGHGHHGHHHGGSSGHHHHHNSRHSSSRDPLALAERGKIGMPHSSSECSSNSSVEASVESNTGLVGGEKKDRRLILQSASGGGKGGTPAKDMSSVDGKKDQGNSVTSSSAKYGRLPVQQQDSLEDVPDINSNQDVSIVLYQISVLLLSCFSSHIHSASSSFHRSPYLIRVI